MARSTADKLHEAVTLLESVARRGGYVLHREGDSVERLVMLARSIAFQWPDPDRRDEAPTQKLPPVRDSIGARRQPPALRTLPPGSAELLHLIADALKADEDLADEDGPTL